MKTGRNSALLHVQKCNMNYTMLLKDGVAFITLDWAMKWLPRQFRETQAEWWAKRGISWHIAVVETMVRKPGTTELFVQTDVYVSICETNVAQEASIVLAILVEVIKAYHNKYPSIKSIWLR